MSVTGNWLLQNIMTMTNYTTLCANLDNLNVLSSMTLTPLKAAQYSLTLQMAGSGVPFVAFTYLASSGVVSAAQPNEGYETKLVWNLVCPHQSTYSL